MKDKTYERQKKDSSMVKAPKSRSFTPNTQPKPKIGKLPDPKAASSSKTKTAKPKNGVAKQSGGEKSSTAPKTVLKPASRFANYTVQYTLGPEDVDELDDDEFFPELDGVSSSAAGSSIKSNSKHESFDDEQNELDDLDADDYEVSPVDPFVQKLGKQNSTGPSKTAAASSAKSSFSSASSLSSLPSASADYKTSKKRDGESVRLFALASIVSHS